jgi:hypothetical protein
MKLAQESGTQEHSIFYQKTNRNTETEEETDDDGCNINNK